MIDKELFEALRPFIDSQHRLRKVRQINPKEIQPYLINKSNRLGITKRIKTKGGKTQAFRFTPAGRWLMLQTLRAEALENINEQLKDDIKELYKEIANIKRDIVSSEKQTTPKITHAFSSISRSDWNEIFSSIQNEELNKKLKAIVLTIAKQKMDLLKRFTNDKDI